MIIISIFYCFGILLNLFEEIEFFKNIEVNILTPLLLTSLIIPSLIIKILPFIVFISSMWFMLKLRNSSELSSLKIYGYSNFRIFLILATASLFIGWIVLFVANPITSSMVQYYEKTKSFYSKDIDHLILFNKNGMWIKENIEKKQRIISAKKTEETNILDVEIYHIDTNSKLLEKIISEKADITNKKWVLNNAVIFKPVDGILVKNEKEFLSINSNYDYETINSLFRNFDTLSFFDLLFNYDQLIDGGYNEVFLNQSFHSMLSMPFFLFLMTALASILTMNALKRADNIKFIVVGLITCIIIFYLKDLSLALGQTGQIPLKLAIWSPIIVLSF